MGGTQPFIWVSFHVHDVDDDFTQHLHAFSFALSLGASFCSRPLDSSALFWCVLLVFVLFSSMIKLQKLNGL